MNTGISAIEQNSCRIVGQQTEPSIQFNNVVDSKMGMSSEMAMKVTSSEIIFNEKYTIDETAKVFISIVSEHLDKTYGQKIRKLDNLVDCLLGAREMIGKENTSDKYYLGFYNAIEFLMAAYEMREPELK